MKKFTFTTILLIIVFTIKAQTLYKCYSAVNGRYSSVAEKWIYEEEQPCNLVFTFQGKTVMVNDSYKSVYNTSTIITQGSNYTVYRARDERNVACLFKIAKDSKGETQIHVIYGFKCIVYFLDTDDTLKL